VHNPATGVFPRFDARPSITIRMSTHLDTLNLAWLATLLFVSPSLAQTAHRPPPASPKDFAVMAWGDSPSDPEQLRGMREAGLNISGSAVLKISNRFGPPG
jgi:hypothetical protein